MRSDSYEVTLNDEELKVLIEVLNYALEYCPIEGITTDIEVTSDQVQDLIDKMESVPVGSGSAR